METDPVCGARVDRVDAFQSEYRGEIYFFCSRECQQSFSLRPDRFAETPALEYDQA